MQVKYFKQTDSVIIKAPGEYERGSGGSLRDDFGVTVGYASPGSDEVVDVDIFDVSDFLPLRAERGYDAATDTLTLGEKPAAGYRAVESGDFVSYRQWIEDGGYWDLVALDLRQASRHLAPAIAAQPAPPVAANNRPGIGV